MPTADTSPCAPPVASENRRPCVHVTTPLPYETLPFLRQRAHCPHCHGCRHGEQSPWHGNDGLWVTTVLATLADAGAVQGRGRAWGVGAEGMGTVTLQRTQWHLAG